MGIDLLETDIRLPTEEQIKHHPEYNQGNAENCKGVRGRGKGLSLIVLDY
jgi:hypothetical protein